MNILNKLKIKASRKLKTLIEQIFKIKLIKKMPFGNNVFEDIAFHFPYWAAHTIFDVGANNGQTAQDYSKIFSSAKIFCFEPASKTFLELRRRTEKNKNIFCFNIGLSSRSGTASLEISNKTKLSKIIKTHKKNTKTEKVVLQTVNNIFKLQKLKKISFLKIDTEGGDLEVLKGSNKILRKQKAEFIQVEAGFSKCNITHVSFWQLITYLRKYKYKIFGFYEQVYEWKKNMPHLRRANIVFLSALMDKKNKRHND